jgi:hypothetical protein
VFGTKSGQNIFPRCLPRACNLGGIKVDWRQGRGGLQVGAVGYVYDQITGDSGAGAKLGRFESRVIGIGIGPQVGYLFPVGGMQGYVNLKAYGEFDARNRPSGWNAWLTLSISPAAPAAPTSAKW